jgi:hypothetical protein
MRTPPHLFHPPAEDVDEPLLFGLVVVDEPLTLLDLFAAEAGEAGRGACGRAAPKASRQVRVGRVPRDGEGRPVRVGVRAG